MAAPQGAGFLSVGQKWGKGVSGATLASAPLKAYMALLAERGVPVASEPGSVRAGVCDADAVGAAYRDMQSAAHDTGITLSGCSSPNSCAAGAK